MGGVQYVYSLPGDITMAPSSEVFIQYLSNTIGTQIAFVQQSALDITNELNSICKSESECTALIYDCRENVGGLLPTSILHPLQELYSADVEHINSATLTLQKYLVNWRSIWNASKSHYTYCASTLSNMLNQLASETKAFCSYYEKYLGGKIASEIQHASTFCNAHEEIISDLQLTFNGDHWTYKNMAQGLWPTLCIVFGEMIACQFQEGKTSCLLDFLIGVPSPPCPPDTIE